MIPLSNLLDRFETLHKQCGGSAVHTLIVTMQGNEALVTQAIGGGRVKIICSEPKDYAEALVLMHNNVYHLHRWQHARKLMLLHQNNQWLLANLDNPAKKIEQPKPMASAWVLLIDAIKQPMKQRLWVHGEPLIFIVHVALVSSLDMSEGDGREAFEMDAVHVRPFADDRHCFA
jgi:hypothetical protein